VQQHPHRPARSFPRPGEVGRKFSWRGKGPTREGQTSNLNGSGETTAYFEPGFRTSGRKGNGLTSDTPTVTAELERFLEQKRIKSVGTTLLVRSDECNDKGERAGEIRAFSRFTLQGKGGKPFRAKGGRNEKKVGSFIS